MKTKKIALYGVLTAVALILSYVEAQLPSFTAIPGIKLGLTNIVVLIALYFMGNSAALGINILRIILVTLLFGNGASLAFSAAGGILSTLVMIVLKRTERFQIISVSVAGGITHNIGQILAAVIILNTKSIAWYLPVLWFSGIISGAVIGLLSAMLCKRLAKTMDGEG